MLKVVTATAVALMLATTAASAQTPSISDCKTAAERLGERAERMSLTDSEEERIEDLLEKMEEQCEARDFVGALASGKLVKAMLDAKG
ncbi:MAG: hypothetical protein R3D31_01500 [Hyphomicrobiaceae bacterium]